MTEHLSDDSCTCSDYRATRRTVLKGGLAVGGAAVATSMVGDVFTQTAFGATSDGNVLVVLSMRGGADGLSLVVPYTESAYYTARPFIAVPANSLLAKDTTFGLHPSFAPLLPMWTSGKMAAVQAVGLPQPNRSHFSAMEEVEDADLGSAERRGWINRMVGLLGPSDPIRGMQLGNAVVPTELYGSEPTVALTNYARIGLSGAQGSWATTTRDSLTGAWEGVDSALGRSSLAALAVSQRMAGLSTPQRPLNGASYPASSLGQALSDTARTIRANLGARIVAIDSGAWDHHVNLGTVQAGLLKNNVVDLARSLAAFFADLGTVGDRVTVLTISEFGRRVHQNGGQGADHGYGNCMFALGAGVRGGYKGRWPGLADGNLIGGDLAVTTDYRSVLSEAVAARFPEVSVPNVFPGFVRETVGVF